MEETNRKSLLVTYSLIFSRENIEKIFFIDEDNIVPSVYSNRSSCSQQLCLTFTSRCGDFTIKPASLTFD